MTRVSPSRHRLRCRPDRAAFHAELTDVNAMHGVWTLRDLVVDAGGPDGEAHWEELLELLRTAKKEIGSRASISAAIRSLTVLAGLHKRGTRGYRGFIAPLEEWAAHVERLTGYAGGCSLSTIREGLRLLEAAGLGERTIHGRGRDEEYGTSPTGEPLKARRMVACFTLSTVAVSFWSGPRAHRRPPVGEKTTPPNLGGNTSGEEKVASLPGDARSTSNCRPELKQCSSAVSPVPGDVVSRAATAAASSKGSRASRVPLRRWTWRPSPDEPHDHAHNRQAILFDLETWLLKAKRPDLAEVLRVAAAELSPDRMIAGVIGGDRGPPGSGVPWDELVWRWRGLPLEDRRVVCQRSILPAVVGYLRRVELYRMPAEPLTGPRCRGEPGPRARPLTTAPLPPSPRIEVRPRAGPRREQERIDDAWLQERRRRYGVEEV